MLELSANNITGSGAQLIFGGLQKNPYLLFLDIGQNPLSDKGVGMANKYLKKNRKLEVLDLFGVCFGD